MYLIAYLNLNTYFKLARPLNWDHFLDSVYNVSCSYSICRSQPFVISRLCTVIIILDQSGQIFSNFNLEILLIQFKNYYYRAILLARKRDISVYTVSSFVSTLNRGFHHYRCTIVYISGIKISKCTIVHISGIKISTYT